MAGKSKGLAQSKNYSIWATNTNKTVIIALLYRVCFERQNSVERAPNNANFRENFSHL